MVSQQRNKERIRIREYHNNKQMGKKMQITITEHKRYLVYWHKFANSGVWEFDNIQSVNDMVNMLKKQESVYSLVVFDTQEKTRQVIKSSDVIEK